MIANRRETDLAEHDSRHWPHVELATDDPWRFDGNPFEGRRHPQALDLSLTQGSVTNALQIGCAAVTFDEVFRPAAITSGCRLSALGHPAGADTATARHRRPGRSSAEAK
ncbi:hypothetical protein C7I87_22145 [Mesorhizobium sp. SARCC-RB16n]|uniref:SAM-dependent methyltransferase n=1 Tax=Mesorhizobium sp. SARCC-RB16n TaxID=2116687 RepID=UPI00122F8276|nr:SAM-dependent methyltransferase [Mesorhizobium sp. SARCC-RB16n]KAA3448417.1 hypothetical protein C7I87_22145 [Mesorhizobium sp. SARCC-RB16n]